MDPIITSAVVSFTTAFATSSFNNATGPAQALDDAMALVGFDKLHMWAEKRRTKQDFELKRYKEQIAQEIIKIPEGNLQEPKLSIIGPALEASKYYIEEEELSEMFARLISSSMDSSKDSLVHPSYVEIIKQMTPLDAENLMNIVKGEDLIAQIRIDMDKNRYSIQNTHLFLGNPNCNDQNLLAPSIENLSRLKLIDVSYGTYSPEENAYDKFELMQEYAILKNGLEESRKAVKLGFMEKNSVNDIKEVSIVKGLIEIPLFGKNFCNICLA